MNTSQKRHEPGRHALRALLLLLGLLALMATGGPAGAATGCGKKVIDDWFDGRIDGTYPLHCYDDAIDQLPRDVRDYSSAKEDIERALQARLRGEKPPPNTRPSGTETDEEPNEVPPAADPNGPTRGDDPEAIPPGTDNAENASSVPLPLLLLAGLALLLVAGGAAGYVVRRVQARRVTPPAL
jgi:hypothetical protein